MLILHDLRNQEQCEGKIMLIIYVKVNTRQTPIGKVANRMYCTQKRITKGGGNAVSHKTDLAKTAFREQVVSLWRHPGRDPTSSPEK